MPLTDTSVTTRRLDDLVQDTGAFAGDTSLEVQRFPGQDAPQVAFVVPVHDQAERISTVLDSILATSVLPHELVVVLDDCTDGSEEIVTAWARSQRGVAITLVTARDAIFETLCDAVGIAVTTAPFVIEVQADMIIDEPGFDRLLVGALREHQDVFAVSGRGAHSADLVVPPARPSVSRKARLLGSRVAARVLSRRSSYRPTRLELACTAQIGRCGDLIDQPLSSTTPRRLYLHDTVMRGPLALRRDVYDAVDGFDTTHFFLGDDDHDLIARVWEEEGMRVGFVPMSFSSPLDAGSTRRPRPAAAQARFTELRAHYGAAAEESFLHSGRRTRPLERPSVRPLAARTA